jgi:hypothetical protein
MKITSNISKVASLILVTSIILFSCSKNEIEPDNTNSAINDPTDYGVLERIKITVDGSEDYLDEYAILEYENNNLVKISMNHDFYGHSWEYIIILDAEGNPKSYSITSENNGFNNTKTNLFYDTQNRLLRVGAENGLSGTDFDYSGNNILATSSHSNNTFDNTYKNYKTDPNTGYINWVRTYSDPNTPVQHPGYGVSIASDLVFGDIETPKLFKEQNGFFNFHNSNNVFLMIGEYPIHNNDGLSRLPFTELDVFINFDYLPVSGYEKTYDYEFNADTTNIISITRKDLSGHNRIKKYDFHYKEK